MENTLSYSSYLKSPFKSIKHTTYFQAYDDLFTRFRGRNITFVEIGVLGGGSLFMWRDFFGDQARIIGIDLNPNAQKWSSEGFEIYIGNQGDESFWLNFIEKVGPVDIVLDDGGHTFEQQIITAECLLKNINDGGMLVVEDTHTSYMKGYGFRKYSFIEYVKKFIDRINHRFRDLSIANSDHRVWSIQVYESMVAFHINRSASKLQSAPTSNNGVDEFMGNPIDYRYADSQVLNIIEKFRFIKRIPGWRTLKNKVFDISSIINSRSRISKYFDN